MRPEVRQLAEGDRTGWDRELKLSLLLVRTELGAIAKLLDSAAAFHRDLLKVISGATPCQVVEINAPADQKARRVHVLG